MRPISTAAPAPRRARARVALALPALALLGLTGCVIPVFPGGAPGSGAPSTPGPSAPAPTPEQSTAPPPATAGEEPAGVVWPAEWLSAQEAGDRGPSGTVVEVELESLRGGWVWEVTLRPEHGSAGPETDGSHGRPGLITVLSPDGREVQDRRSQQLDAEQRVEVSVSALQATEIADAAQPDARLVELVLDEERGAPVWEATLRNFATGLDTDLTIDAQSGEILTTEAG